jgi:hypothetical protein
MKFKYSIFFYNSKGFDLCLCRTLFDAIYMLCSAYIKSKTHRLAGKFKYKIYKDLNSKEALRLGFFGVHS